ncbi:MAG: hypothetical protein LBI04_04640 [Treponema sp.]|jgi:hypothetical protein|nr:hypothetical protein [Treponema sp.]
MKKKIIISLMVVCLLAFVTVLAFSQNSPSVRWEYRVLNLYSVRGADDYADLVPTMNNLGKEGWECIGAPGAGDEFIFKRRLP